MRLQYQKLTKSAFFMRGLETEELGKGTLLVSYRTPVVFFPDENEADITLDPNWNVTPTTTNHVTKFLSQEMDMPVDVALVRKLIDDGSIEVKQLNHVPVGPGSANVASAGLRG